uniref:Reverse transcriptase domain-containing protein n=1 Tax=Parastrongyloides trichosuri TaxID=131310 RepID=A0A0N4ZL55_PARTI
MSSNLKSSNKDNNLNNLDLGEIHQILKLLPKCRITEDWKVIIDAENFNQVEEISKKIKKPVQSIMKYLDFEFKNRMMLDLPITTLPIPKEDVTKKRKAVLEKFQLKHRELPQSINDPPINEDVLSRSCIPNQLRSLNDEKFSHHRRKRLSTYETLISALNNENPGKDLCSPIKKTRMSEHLLDNTTIDTSFDVEMHWDKIENEIIPKETYADKLKKNLNSGNKKLQTKKKNKNNTKLRKPFKDLNPEERWKILEKSKGPIFRYRVNKWTPIDTIDRLLNTKLEKYNELWKQPSVSEKDASTNWRKAVEQLKIAAKLLKSYDNTKIDIDGMKIDNIVKIKRARNKTMRFINRVNNLIHQRNSTNRKEKASANFKIRRIIQTCRKKRKDVKMENIEQILHFNNDKVKNLDKRTEIVQKKNDDQKVRFKFNLKPSLKSLGPSIQQKVDIPNKKLEDFLIDLFKEENTKDNGLLQQWIEETNFEQQKRTFMWNEELFENTLKYSRGWKAAGLNKIYLSIFKQLNSAKTFLKNWCFGILNNTIKLSKYDVAGKAFPIYKSGDRMLPQNYRFINVLNCHFKILSKMMNDMIREHLINILPFEQQANQKGKDGLLDGIIINRILQNSSGSDGSQLNQAWIDFKRAFDTISHSKLKLILTKVGIDKRLLDIIFTSMKHWSFKINSSKSKTWIKLHKGIYQGDSMSPTLFILSILPLSHILNKEATIALSPNIKLNHIKFYDDIKLFAKTPEHLSTLVSRVEKFGEEIGLLTNAKKCAYTIDNKENNISTDEMAYSDYNELKATYKYLGIEEDQYGSNTKENINKLYESLKKSLDLVLSSPLSVGNMVRAINTCILPKVLFVFSHQGEPTIRNRIADKIDSMIRKHMNEHKVKMDSISNARLYLSKQHMGLGLKNTHLELDKINLKNYVHIHYTKFFNELRDKLAGFKKLFEELTRKYGLKIEYLENQLKVNDLYFESEKECKRYITECLDKIDEELWLKRYSQKRIFPATVVEQKLFSPWTWHNDLSPKMYKNIIMIQEAVHPQLNGPPNPNSKCGLINAEGHRCNKYDHPKHVLSECEQNNGNKKIRHNQVLYEITKQIAMVKLMKYISFEDSRNEMKFKNFTMTVDQPFSFNITLYHSRPDLIFYFKDKIIVAELSISSYENLDVAANLKRQRYTLYGEKELRAPIPREKEHEYIGKNNFVKSLRIRENKEVDFIPLIIGNFGELNSSRYEDWKRLFEALEIKGFDKIISKISRRTAIESEFLIYKYLKTTNRIIKKQDEEELL